MTQTYNEQEICCADEVDFITSQQENTVSGHRQRLGLLTGEELEDETAVQEKVYAYCVQVGPNFKQSGKVISVQECSICCSGGFLRKGKRLQ